MSVTKPKINLISDDDGNASIGEMENQSGRDEASSGSPSIERLGGSLGLGLGGGGRKRKSRNPTRINLANMMDDDESKIKTGLDSQGKVTVVFDPYPKVHFFLIMIKHDMFFTLIEK